MQLYLVDSVACQSRQDWRVSGGRREVGHVVVGSDWRWRVVVADVRDIRVVAFGRGIMVSVRDKR